MIEPKMKWQESSFVLAINPLMEIKFTTTTGTEWWIWAVFRGYTEHMKIAP